ncbi:hypothetical protein KSD_77700 [Ktedonobacter sp. SOSP1-85]|uniref:amino acid adenylation domain-containing protein n=1 Tax=Ktedonobacter sp. SOSP1-85 TaxID=2778367 RepID=UPI0019164A12|nr:non-ribosomal peptide synthetase [Ktedonobacter sp. SOSP1-85]GHO79999.1 hypothetical protein KSD_77700 [Ktedonobacter sp. SOSP1-85]
MQTADVQAVHLSQQQERLWGWLQNHEVERTQGMFLFEGPLSFGALQEALTQLVEGHEILRTSFAILAGMDQPMQMIQSPAALLPPLMNLSCLDEEQQKTILDEHWQTQHMQRRDLQGEHVLTAELFQLEEERHVLLLRLSVLCADAETLQVVLDDLLKRYQAILNGEGRMQDEEELQYVDISAWQQELGQGDENDSQQEFWRGFDVGERRSVRLPFEREERDARPPRRAQTLEVNLERAWQQRIRLSGASLEAYILACWQIMLWRLTRENPLIGVACDGRGDEDLRRAPGPYARTVPFALTLDASMPFERALTKTSLALQEVQEKQLYFRWEELAPELERQEQRFPLSFAYQQWPEHWQVGGLQARLLRQSTWQEPASLHLHVLQMGERLTLQLRYQPTLFTSTQAQQLLSMLQHVIEQVIVAPQTSLGTLTLLNETQQRQVQTRWQGIRRDWLFAPLHTLFTHQAEQHPQAPALRWGLDLWSYEQLEQQSNQLAHLLQQRGLHSGGRVALCLPRGATGLISLLGVLKAGGTYVPLDMEAPTARLAHLLEQIEPALIISSAQIQERLPQANAPLLLWETLGEQLATCPKTPPSVEVTPHQIAYVMYTSGSTGWPKGVEVTHLGVSNYTQALCEQLALTPGLHLATVSSLAADLGNTSIFCAWACGGCLHLLSEEQIRDGAAFADYVRISPLDVLKIVPSHLQALLAGGGSDVLPRAHLLLGGEELRWSLVEQLQQLGGSYRLYNHYGPTETTIGALINELGPIEQVAIPSQEQRGRSVPLGRPIANMQAFILDEQQQWVPTGVSGELYLGGADLAAGYVQQPEQTQERFLELLVGGEKQRLYRTGDWVREGEEGTLTFLGRRDDQIKLRGYRIELGEIEEQVRHHGGVREAVVQLWQEEGEPEQLVGYVVPWEMPGPGAQQLREALETQVPGYMLPSAWVQLERLPLTSNGKLDRQRLPRPERESQATPERREEARTPVEELMLGIWEEVLGRKGLGRQENFFQLGGHSLLGTRLIARVRAVFGVEVPIPWLFEAPTIAQLSERVEGQIKGGEQSVIPGIERVSREEALPLSFAQQRLWFLHQLDPQSTAYTIPNAVRLRGSIDIQALDLALHLVIQRHESLRTTFPSQGAVAVQHIGAAPSSPLTVLDLRSLPPAAREPIARSILQQHLALPFDLAHGPLLRSWLLQLDSQDQVLLLSMHHIISDGWSSGILTQELIQLYQAASQGLPPTLPPLPIQYADYALWQRQWLQGPVLQEQLSYWKTQLAGITPLTLPTDAPRPAIQRVEGARLHQLVPLDLLTRLQALSQRQGVTLFMTLLAAFQVLLARLSGQQDIAVGTPIANRTRDEVEGLIGFFVNTLVLRCDLSGTPSFLDLLTQVRQVCLQAYAHQDLPFEQVVEAVQPQRDRSRSPLFQVLFSQPNLPTQAEEPLSLATEEFRLEQHTSKFELQVVVAPSEQGLRTTIEYATALFAPATIARLLRQWQLVLEQLLDAPEQPIGRLCLLSQDERDQLLHHWNQAQEPLPPLSVQQLFEAQVARTPERIALICAEEQLSYATLNARANQLARTLRAQGVGPEVLVGLCLSRTPELLVALLAVLKAGGAYVPLDPAYPRERLAFMSQDAGLRVLLTRQELRERLPHSEVPVLCLDQQWPTISQQRAENLQVQVLPEQLAYMIYTSGSTGQPKGAMITQQGLLNYVTWSRQAYDVAGGTAALVHSSPSFDLTVTSLYPALLAGCGVRLLPQEQDLQALAQQVRNSQQMSVLKITPAGLRALTELLGERALAGKVRALVIGGEALASEVVAPWRRHAPQTRLINEYGPTETVVGCCVYEVGAEDTVEGEVPIGRPIANTQLYVLDEHQELVPIGVEGELYIGGVGLARGYRQRPEQTAERFVPHPFSERGGERLYRTGDRARYRADGTLEYLGRRDEQIKLRGYRIELGEIEAALNGLAGVKQSVVILLGDTPEEQRLVAYLVGEEGEEKRQVKAWRDELKQVLPEYMVPSQYVQLDAFPLTPNGKVDRRNLPVPGENEVGMPAQDDDEDALTPIQAQVLQIFKELLKLPQIGLNENFFEIGGHSLRALQVISRVNRLFGVKLVPGSIFEAPTVTALAGKLQQEMHQKQVDSIPALVPVPRTEDLPLSFAQKRLWFLHQLDPQGTAYTIFNAVRLQGRLSQTALQQSLQALQQRHESLRTTFEEQDGEVVQRVHLQAQVDLQVVDLSDSASEHREKQLSQLIQAEAEKPFDLSRGPLWRATLLKEREDEHILLLSMHHIISDGWSMGVLVRELSALYQAFVEHQPSPLTPLPIQYADYAAWQRRWLQGEVLREQVRYWTRQLSEARAVELPGDYPRPQVMSQSGARYAFRLDEELTQRLKKLSQQEGATLFMLLLSGLQVLLYRLSGQEDIVVGTDSANRTQLETEGLIGFFINMLALRTNLSGNPKFLSVLRGVREMVLGAYMHQELPFETVVEHLRLERVGSRTPLVNVLFVMQNVPTTEVELPGLVLEGVDREKNTAKFDLALFVTEDENRLYVSINYSTDLFREESIVAFAERYQALLRSIVAQPNTKIISLEMATEDEKERKTKEQQAMRQQLKGRRAGRLQLPGNAE